MMGNTKPDPYKELTLILPSFSFSTNSKSMEKT